VSTVQVPELLPILYRLRDVDRGGALEALLALVEEQARIVKDDVEGLWDDLFVETCRDWVIPYIGDLLGNVPLYEVVRGRRADVAKTIYYRRRKGVLPMLEELAADVTGWYAHAVACFELLGWTQNLNHLRYSRAPESTLPSHVNPPAVDRVGFANVRTRDAMDRLGGPFEETTHTVDVRRMTQTEGRYGIHKVAYFLWRLEAFRLARTTAHRVATADPHRYTFSSLGNPTPLFSRPAPPSIDRDIAGEGNIPGPIRPLAFHAAPGDWYGAGASFIVHGVGVGDLLCKDLRAWAAPPPSKIAIDVKRGRIMFGTSKAPANDPQVSYRYGFSARIGGGPYPRERRRDLAPGVAPARGEIDAVDDPDAWGFVLHVAKSGAPFTTLNAALLAWDPVNQPRTVIQIDDSATYNFPGGGQSVPTAPAGAQLRIQAQNRERPTLVGDLVIPTTGLAHLTLDGLLLAGSVQLQGELDELVVRHCTLVPGIRLKESGAPLHPELAALTAVAVTRPRDVVIERSILGPIRLPAELHTLRVTDSIVDAPAGPPQRVALAANDTGTQPGPETTVERSTVFGAVHIRELRLGSNAIFVDGALTCDRRQAGCVRFSYVDTAISSTPRRYRCQPDLALENVLPADEALVRARVRPVFTSVRYGEPGYAQLAVGGPCEIATGADDGSEMGAFSHLRQPQRVANLRLRLEEYLPFGLEPGLVYVT
jgi:hypothetical protein